MRRYSRIMSGVLAASALALGASSVAPGRAEAAHPPAPVQGSTVEQLTYEPALGEPGEQLAVELEREPDPSMATPGGYRYDTGEVAWVAREHGLSDADARRVLAMSHTAPVLAEEAARRYPDTFGGAWIDGSQARLVVQFTADAAENTQNLAHDHPHGDQLHAVTVARPLATLEATRDLLAASAAQLAVVGVHGFGIDVPQNAVYVETSGSMAAATDVLHTITGGAQIEVRRGDAPQDYYTWGTANVDNCPIDYAKCNPLRGGAVFHRSGQGTSSPECSQAFFARSNASGHRRMLTAGHCGAELPTAQPSYHHYGVLVGGVAIEDNCTRDCRVDAQAHVVENGWQMGPYLIHKLSTFDESYPVEGIWRGGDLTSGAVLCTTGAYSGVQPSLNDTNCRQIIDPNFSVTVSGRNFYNLIRIATPCGTTQDSGAPLYAGFTAYGLLKGGNPDGCHFSQIRNVEVALNLTVQEFQ